MIHGVALDADDGRLLAQRRSALVWSPRSNLALYGSTAPIRMLMNQGVLMTVGTDSTPTGSSTLPRELTCAADFSASYLDQALSDRDLWLMATYHPALALKVADKIGSLKTGLFGDIVVYDGSTSSNPYRAGLDATAQSTLLVLRRSSSHSRSSVVHSTQGASPNMATPASFRACHRRPTRSRLRALECRDLCARRSPCVAAPSGLSLAGNLVAPHSRTGKPFEHGRVTGGERRLLPAVLVRNAGERAHLQTVETR